MNENDANTEIDEAPDALSPAVRRLVKQYGLDAATIRGTGPDGRLRVTDVMAVLGNRGAPLEPRAPLGEALPLDAELPLAAEAIDIAAVEVALPAPSAAFSVFEMDVDAWLDHRERERAAGRDRPFVAYFVSASIGALAKLGGAAAGCTCIDVLRSTLNGSARAQIDVRSSRSLAEVGDALRSPAPARETAPFALHDYSATGCLFASAPALEGRAAVLGIGRARGARAYLTLNYDPAQITLEDANRFLADVTRYRP